MGSHHKNSRESYEKCKSDGKFVKIIHKIAKFYEDNKNEQFTDRAVKVIMYQRGSLPFDDMNMVRPKITKLIKDELLVEVGEVFDNQTKRNVRVVQWNTSPNDRQMRFY